MSPLLIESVPNFSAGRDAATVAALADVFRGAGGGLRLLDQHADPDHNRCVFTLVGPALALEAALLSAASLARERIDLRVHQGAHPCIGALDVCPFIALRGAEQSEALALARRFGRRLGETLQQPVFLYGDAAQRPERRELSSFRNQGYAKLAERLGHDAAMQPDHGPARIQERSGATAVGVRFFLIALNIQLDTRDLTIAREMARLVRASSGGLPHCKALGLPLASQGLVQVSLNLTDYRVTPPRRAYEAVAELALAREVEIVDSELVGLAPAAAFPPEDLERLRLRGFRPDRLLESHGLKLDDAPRTMPA